MTRKWMHRIFLMGILLFFFGCGHMAYMGMHGRSIKLYPDVHASIVEDRQCIGCHGPDDPQGPVSPHPGFTGCIKCHND